MVAAFLTERSLPIPDDLGSNQQFSWNIIFRYCQMSFEKTKLMKSSWELQIFKANVLFNNFPYGRYLHEGRLQTHNHSIVRESQRRHCSFPSQSVCQCVCLFLRCLPIAMSVETEVKEVNDDSVRDKEVGEFENAIGKQF